jgi:DNA polymerase-3 subunit delta'
VSEEAAAVQLPVEVLPWHVHAHARLQAAVTAGRLPHAVLVQGPAGVGKEVFASAIAAALFCRERGPGLVACGHCAECRLYRNGTHPDMHWVRPPEDRKSIGVDQVREACEQLSMTAMRRGARVAVFAPAEAMTPSAQNALLKTLEEPSPGTLIVLVAARPSRLLATLRSRCQRLEVACPPGDAVLPWLEAASGGPVPAGLLEACGGAPLRALALAPHYADLDAHMSGLLEAVVSGRAEACAAAADMMGDGLPYRLDWLEGWLARSIRARAAPSGTPLTVPRGSLLQRTAAELNIGAAFRLLDRVREVRRLLEGSAAAQLLVESLLVEAAGSLGHRGLAG